MVTKKCPVCDWAMTDDVRTVEAGGKTITVCCDDCAAKVHANPTEYVKPRARGSSAEAV